MKTKGQTVRQIDIVSNTYIHTHTHSGTFGRVRQNYLGLKPKQHRVCMSKGKQAPKDFYGRACLFLIRAHSYYRLTLATGFRRKILPHNKEEPVPKSHIGNRRNIFGKTVCV